MNKENQSENQNSANQTEYQVVGGGENNGQKISKSWFDVYFAAVKAGLVRAWQSKFLWFWAILLGGGGSSFRLNSSDFGGKNKGLEGKADFASFKEGFGNFLSEMGMNWQIFAVIVLAFIFLMIVFWFLSAIARRGIVSVLHDLQEGNFASGDGRFGVVWQRGKVGFAELLKLDFAVGIAVLIFLALLAVPVGFFIASENWAGAILVGILALLFFIFVAFVVSYVKKIAEIIVILANEGFYSALEAGYGILKNNLGEVLKLFLTFLLLGIVTGIVGFFWVILLMVPFVGSLFAGFFILGFDFENFPPFEEFVKTLFTSSHGLLAMGVVFLGFLVFLVGSLVFGAIVKLWDLDVWVWWTKKVGGARALGKEHVVEEVGKKKVLQEAYTNEEKNKVKHKEEAPEGHTAREL